MKPAEAFDLTPREFAAFCRGREKHRAESWRREMWGAWHAAAFTRAKRVPDLARILRKLGGAQAPEQTPEQALALVVALNQAFGGKDLRAKPETENQTWPQ